MLCDYFITSNIESRDTNQQHVNDLYALVYIICKELSAVLLLYTDRLMLHRQSYSCHTDNVLSFGKKTLLQICM